MEAPDVALNRFNNVQGDSRALTLEMLAVKTLGSGRQHEGRVQGIGRPSRAFAFRSAQHTRRNGASPNRKAMTGASKLELGAAKRRRTRKG